MRRPDADLRYRMLFECVSDGFALLEAVRDPTGRITDYVILDANPALLRMVGWDTSPTGKRQSEVFPQAPAEWLAACETAMQGRPLRVEYHCCRAGRWLEIRCSRITDRQLAQVIVDITERKRVEQQRAEMFDELNHRVKNNLAIVSSMLAMQAQAAEPDVKEQLAAAVDRIQTIADIHTSLCTTGGKDEVDFTSYLHGLCERLSRSLLDPDRVSLKLDAAPASLPLDRAVPLGRSPSNRNNTTAP